MKGKLTSAAQKQQKFSKNAAKAREKTLLGSLVKWAVWIILALTVTVHIVYMSGTYRNASDESQLALVNICLVLSLLLIISSFYGLILELYYAIRKRNAAYLAVAMGYSILIVLGTLALFGAMFVLGAVRGMQ